MFSWFKKKRKEAANKDAWPIFVTGIEPLIRWTHPDGNHRAYVIRNTDGTFSKYSEYFSEEEFELCWIPNDAGFSLYDSEETAIQEILGLYPWAKGVEIEKRPAEQLNSPEKD